MNYLDYIIFVICAIGFLLGFKDGLIRKIIGLIGLVLAIFLAYEYSNKVGKLLLQFFNGDEYLSGIIAALLIFLTTILIATIIKRIIHPFDKVNRAINQFLGGIIGTIQMLFFLSAVFLFLNIFGFPKTEQRNASFSFKFVQNLIPKTVNFIAGRKLNPSEYLKEYIEKKDADSSFLQNIIPGKK